MVKTEEVEVGTQGNCEVVDITGEVCEFVGRSGVREFVGRSGVREGTVTVFNIGSTAGITTTEYEPGLVNHDLEAAFEKTAAEGVGRDAEVDKRVLGSIWRG
jgi:thiamine phosphate synthase YjbQ (UPF0047 family)